MNHDLVVKILLKCISCCYVCV